MTNQRIGYSRVSTQDQRTDSQVDALNAAKVDQLFMEKFTGTKASRPELDKMLSQLRSGDSLVITRLDRLGRSTKDLLNLLGVLQDKGVALEVIEQAIDTATAEGRLFFALVASFSEFESSIMRARTIDGLAAARARGRVGGRKPKMTPARIAEAKKLYAARDKTVQEIADIFQVSRPTIYRAIEGGNGAHSGVELKSQ
jgi:DNA invertase Pin-like site-specific DNA recombinase